MLCLQALAKEIREFRSPTDGETRMFYEIVVAPKYTKKGLEILRGKSKTLRILEANKNEKGKLSLRQVGGGWLAQDSDDLTPQDIQFKVVTQKAPQESELGDAEFAWLCVKHVKSNAIVIAKVVFLCFTFKTPPPLNFIIFWYAALIELVGTFRQISDP